MSVNQAAAPQHGGMRGKPHVIAESFHIEHSLLTAILAAAETAQVRVHFLFDFLWVGELCITSVKVPFWA